MIFKEGEQVVLKNLYADGSPGFAIVICDDGDRVKCLIEQMELWYEKSRVQDMKLYTESNMKNFTGRKEYLK